MKAWWIVGDYDTQEYQYQTSKISEIAARWAGAVEQNASQFPIKNTVQTPLILKKEGKEPLYVDLGEAALINYRITSGSDSQNYKFKTHLTPDAQGAKGYIQTPFNTPWRTIIVSPSCRNLRF